jgi:hypothetical protein
MSIDTKSDKYKTIIDIAKFKILIARQINWCLNNLVYEEKWNNLDELYNCHKIIFKNNKLQPQLNRCIYGDDITQQFTIHHFMYYLIAEVVKVFKLNSKRIIEYDIINLLIMNIETAYEIHLDLYDLIDLLIMNIEIAYEIHLCSLITKIYEYLSPKVNIQILSNLFLIFKKISIGVYTHDEIMKIINNYDNFTEWTECDLLYNLMYCIESLQVNRTLIHIIYYQIVENINENGNFTMNDVIKLIETYKQIQMQERLKIYEEELIMKTWHPNRLMDWCLDIEEKNDFA